MPWSMLAQALTTGPTYIFSCVRSLMLPRMWHMYCLLVEHNYASGFIIAAPQMWWFVAMAWEAACHACVVWTCGQQVQWGMVAFCGFGLGQLGMRWVSCSASFFFYHSTKPKGELHNLILITLLCDLIHIDITKCQTNISNRFVFINISIHTIIK